jgi:hypothetical protein
LEEVLRCPTTKGHQQGFASRSTRFALRAGEMMTENETILRRLSSFVKVVFLLCLAALIPLGVAEWYSGQNVPYETREAYDTLEKILVGIIIACIIAWIVAEAWREIQFHRGVKSK